MMSTRFRDLLPLLLCAAPGALWLPAATAAAPAPPADEPSARFLAEADGLPAFARPAWEATVFLETRTWITASGHRDLATGSGVVVAFDPGKREVLIATSSHVVPCDTACVIRVVFPRAEAARRTVTSRARRIWHDHRQDLALLRAPAPSGASFEVATVAVDGTAPDAAAGPVLAIGFPDPALYGRHARERDKRYSEGALVGTRRPFRSEYRAYASTAVEGSLEQDAALLHSAELLPGSSGGPLVDGRGRVLGINTGSLLSKDGDGCFRASTDAGPRCLHLAVALDALLDGWRSSGSGTE